MHHVGASVENVAVGKKQVLKPRIIAWAAHKKTTLCNTEYYDYHNGIGRQILLFKILLWSWLCTVPESL